MVTKTERIMARRQIDALIRADPVDIVIWRKLRVPDGAGGWRWSAPTPILDGEPQRVTLIPFKRRMTEFLVSTELGNVPDLPYVVVGYHTLNIQREDTFTYNGDTFEVQTVDIEQKDVRIAAHVDYFGGATNG